ncbi:LUD domain-containing protein [Nocardia miyunensis]|uniref:LUD domain-containing protein n=1 Tax=Nocardia miyunensis TaxID=282684 RepID=UPI001470E4D4|nr:LUD domain-containing protein [Nocardia miyunensis]
MSREEFLRRVRDGLKALPDDDRTVTLFPGHRRGAADLSPADRSTIVELFVERLEYHGARVARVRESDIPEAVDAALRAQRADTVVAPHGLPEQWLELWAKEQDNQILTEDSPVPNADLDDADAMVTTCAGAVADAGAVVLDGGPGQGFRDRTLAPQCHICVVRTAQIDSSLPEVLDKLDSRRPITWCGGPTAPSDAKTRDHGRHRQRQLIVLIVDSPEFS